MPLAPPPQRSVVSSSASIFANALPSRTTTPGTPPSRTMRLEPRPSAITGTCGIELAQEGDEVVDVGGLEQPFGLAAALEPDQRRERRVRGSAPADLGHGRDARSFARPRLADAVGQRGRPFGDVAGAHADDHVAFGREVAERAAQLVEVGDRATMRWPWARSPSARAALSTPSIGSSPAA